MQKTNRLAQYRDIETESNEYFGISIPPGGEARVGSHERASYPSEVTGMAANPIGTTTDEDVSKGAVEGDGRDARGGNSNESQESMGGQLGHRSNHPDPEVDPMLKDSDTDFPEPDALEEHTGEPGS